MTGSSEEEHLQNLGEVFRRLEQHGLTLHREKCHFLKDSVEYLGQVVSAEGIRTAPDKVQAIVDAPAPRNVHELRSTLGMINYYRRFIPNLSAHLDPLHQLLKAGFPWHWTQDCETAFQEAKSMLSRAPVLAHYDPDVPLVLAADASAYGLGAVLSHVYPEGSERPVAFASRTLTSSEKNYSQVEKEALTLVFGIRKFHPYIYGRHFTLLTDHQPLLSILSPKRGVPTLAAARMQQWALILSAYTYSIAYRSTKDHGNADGLSRIPLSSTTDVADVDVSDALIKQIDSLPVDASELSTASRRDPVLSSVHRYQRHGWPKQVSEELQPYHRCREELSEEGNCLLWGGRVVIPKKLRSRVLEELHRGHPGVVRMKQLARSHAWWPGIDTQIEDAVRACEPCQHYRKAPPAAPLHAWSWPSTPWDRIHVDFLEPFMGKMLMVVMDTHLKWPEVVIMRSTTAASTIEALRNIFARNGLPRHLVSDNGPQFISDEFKQFMRSNGIRHSRTAPYHPASNGAAERLVQSVKQALRAALHTGTPMEQALATFLLRYRTTPHTTTGIAPCALLCNRMLRTRLDLLAPDVRGRVQDQQLKQKEHHDKSTLREFQKGQVVWARDLRGGTCWLRTMVQERLGPVSYRVRLENGELWHRHVDHLREGLRPEEKDTRQEHLDGPEVTDWPSSTPNSETADQTASSLAERDDSGSDIGPTESTSEPTRETASTDAEASAPPHRYPSRRRSRPKRLYASLDNCT